MTWLAGAAVVVGVLAARGPRGRPLHAVAGGGPRAGGTRPGDGRPRSRAVGRARTPGELAPRRARERDLAVVVTDVASRLRAGAEPGVAWSEALGRRVPATGPSVADLGTSAEARRHAAAVVAAARLAAALGSPLAPLLDGVADQLAAQAEAEGERRAALAGPRATARVLTWLPVLGVVLGVAVGADPLAVLLDGSWGTGALVAGAALVLLGRAWTARLARHAAAAGRGP